ncbi:hypothetical protein Tco_1263765 [Tanacetum coccineum]
MLMIKTMMMKTMMMKTLQLNQTRVRRPRGGELKESKSSKKPSTTKETPKGKAPSKGSKTGNSALVKEPVENLLLRQHGRMVLESVENGPLIWPSIEENGVTKPRNILSYLLWKQFKLTVISRQQISFSNDYHLRSMHWLEIIKSPRNFGKELNFSCKELH